MHIKTMANKSIPRYVDWPEDYFIYCSILAGNNQESRLPSGDPSSNYSRRLHSGDPSDPAWQIWLRASQ